MMMLSKTKLSLCAGLIMMCAAPHIASAQSSASLSNLYACETVANKDAQLACFLAATAKLRAGEGLSVPSIAAETDTLAIQRKSLAAESERLALENTRIEAEKARLAAQREQVAQSKKMGDKKAETPKTRRLAIRSTAPGAKGYTRFTLENGEVWQQIESARLRLGKGEPDVLTIKRKSFGSFLANVNDKRPTFRVRRVE